MSVDAPTHLSDPPPSAKPPSGRNAMATMTGLMVMAAFAWVATSIFFQVALPTGDGAGLTDGGSESSKAPQAPAPPISEILTLDYLRPKGVIADNIQETVVKGFFSDQLVCAGWVTNMGGGGRLKVVARAVYDDDERARERGEHDFTILNAGQSAEFRIELSIPNAKWLPQDADRKKAEYTVEVP